MLRWQPHWKSWRELSRTKKRLSHHAPETIHETATTLLASNQAPLASSLRERYPRSGGVRGLRLVLLFCWSLLILYVGNVGWNLYQLAHISLARLTNGDAVIAALVLPGFLVKPNTSPWVYGVSGLLVLSLLVGCIWATIDVRREQQFLQAHALNKLVDHHLLPTIREQLPRTLREIGVGDALDEPSSPPFEERQLPFPAHFVGRIDELHWLEEQLKAGGVTALCGIGGLGKTALAAQAIKQVRAEGRFPDGIAVLFCQGQTDALELLRRMLARFTPSRRQPETSDLLGLEEAVHRLLGGKDALIVLDNVEPKLAVEQIVASLEKTEVTVLLTSRQMVPQTVVPSDNIRLLGLLSAEEAKRVFLDALGQNRAQQLTSVDYSAIERIIQALERHTLAVKLAGAYVADIRRDLPTLAGELLDPQQVLELPAEITQEVGRLFSQSIQELPRDARHLFIALVAFPSGEFSRRAVLMYARMLGLAKPEASLDLLIRRALLEGTVSTILPEEGDRERLRLHALLRAFASARFNRWSEQARNIASQAVASYYASYTAQAGDRGLEVDQENIIGALVWANQHMQSELVVILCAGMQPFWRDHWYTAQSLQYLPWGIAAAQSLVHTIGKPELHLRAASFALTYGQVLRDSGHISDAEHFLQQALTIFRQEGYRKGECEVITQLGQIARQRGLLKEAEGFYEEALTIARLIGDRRDEGWILIFLGQIAKDGGQLAEAERTYQAALLIQREVHDQQSEGMTLSLLGQIAWLQGALEEAEHYLEQSLFIRREIRDRQGEGADLSQLGNIAWRRGQLEDAEVLYQQALTLARLVQDRRGEGIALTALGRLYQLRGQLKESEAYYQEALTIDRQVQDRRGEGVDLVQLGQIAKLRDQHGEAKNYYQQALEVDRSTQNRQGEAMVLFHLAELAEIQGNLDDAEAFYRQSLDIRREVGLNLEVADTLLSLGRFLVISRKDRQEGCRLLQEAVQGYAEQGLSREQEAREVMQQRGCNNKDLVL